MGMEKESTPRVECNTWSGLVLDNANRQQAVVPTGVYITVFPESASNWSLNLVLLFIILYWVDVQILLVVL